MLLLRARGRSCSCGPSSASGLCALIVGGGHLSLARRRAYAGRRPGRAVRPDAGRCPGGAVRLEYDLVVAVNPAVGRLQTGRCGAPTRILVGVAVVAGPGRLRRHLRRRAPAAGAAGLALLLRARGRSCTSPGSTPCSCGLFSASGLCAPIVEGASSSAGPGPGPRGPSSGPGDAP